ncbi:hypothetical protein J6O86_01230 [bacterium]|nr:hypothetical protein [bacterium]
MSWAKISARVLGGWFTRGASKGAQVAEHLAPVRMTKSFTDSASGITTLEREINYNGGSAIAKVEQWIENGKKMSKISINTGDHTPIYRTKGISIDKGGSLFGGDKITIEKDLTHYWCYGEKSALSKEYNKLGELEHKAYSITHNSGNGLNDWSKKAVQDRVYDEFPLTSSVENMLKNPLENRYFQHALNGQNNYHKFAAQGTKYERTIAANKKAALEAAQKAEAEAAAKKAAEEAAIKAEQAIQPRINVGKTLGIDIKDLQRVEKTLADGSIERTYFKAGSSKPVLKTVDKGILHQEWAYGAKGTDMIYMKQVGKETPYILAKEGNSVQISGERLRTSSSDGMPYKGQYGRKYATEDISSLYRYDGIYSVRYNPNGIGINGQVASIKMPYKYHPEYLKADESYKKIIERQFESPYSSTKLALECVDNYGTRIPRDLYNTNFNRSLSPKLKEAFEAAKSDYVDLKDLYRSFEA